jgi:hypothetical protein
MGEGKIEGTLALPVPRLVKNKSDGPASIADDFNTSVKQASALFRYISPERDIDSLIATGTKTRAGHF